MIPLIMGHRYEIDLPGTISESGWSEVTNKFNRCGLPWPNLDVIGSGWMEKGKKFSTRYKNWLNKNYPGTFKNNENDIAIIGEIFRRNCDRVLFTLIPTTDLNWKDGQYADEGSCYWGRNALAREIFMKEGVFAILLERDGRGVGRCWCKPFDGYFALFNAYGPNLNTIARAVNSIVKGKYKRYEGYNDGCQGSLIYINGATYLVGDDLPSISNDHFELDIPTQNVETCFLCAGYEFKEQLTPTRSDESRKYCRKCSKKTGYCDSCRKNLPLYEFVRGECPECIQKRIDEERRHELTAKGPDGALELERQSRRRRATWSPQNSDYSRCYDCGKINGRSFHLDSDGRTFCQEHCSQCNLMYVRPHHTEIVNRILDGMYSMLDSTGSLEHRTVTGRLRDGTFFNYEEDLVTGKIQVTQVRGIEASALEDAQRYRYTVEGRELPTMRIFGGFTDEERVIIADALRPAEETDLQRIAYEYMSARTSWARLPNDLTIEDLRVAPDDLLERDEDNVG